MAEPTPRDYSFGKRTAEDIYTELALEREPVMDKARELARISIPTMFPPQGYRPGDNLPPPNQSINARSIVNLSSRIMFTALPPGQPVLKYNVAEFKLQPEIDQNPQLWAMTQLALARRAQAHKQRLESTGIRSAYVQAAQQLIGAGNVLWRHMHIDSPSVHRMDSYVVKRNAAGEQLFNILEMVVNLSDLDPVTRTFIENVRVVKQQGGDAKELTDEETIYCCCKLKIVSKTRKVWLYWEEFNGEMIPDSDVMTDFEAPPQFAAWMVPCYGSNWGTSYCEQYEGDMYVVENEQGAMNDIAEASSLLWLFVKPGGVTSKRVLDRAQNGRVMYGDANDLSVFRVDKNADAQVVQANLDAATRRLGAAFLMVSAFQRQAERVTAEEWKMMAGELDQAMGGLYSELAQGFGRAVITRFVALHEEEEPMMKPLPKGLISIGVVTGIDAMGISDDEANLENLISLIAKFAPALAQVPQLDVTDLLTRLAAGNNVKPDGLLKTDSDVQAEQQQAKTTAMQQTLLEKGTGPAVGAIAKGIATAVTPAMAAQYQAANQQNGGATTPPTSPATQGTQPVQGQ